MKEYTTLYLTTAYVIIKQLIYKLLTPMIQHKGNHLNILFQNSYLKKTIGFKILLSSKVIILSILMIIGSAVCISAKPSAPPKQLTKAELKEKERILKEKKKELELLKIVEEKPFWDISDDKPRFPGGYFAFKKFIRENQKSPYTKDNVYGWVKCRFIVNTDGSLSNFTIVQNLELYCDAEAVRVLKLSPKWTPAKLHKTPVKAYYTAWFYFKRHKQEKIEKSEIIEIRRTKVKKK